MIKKRLRHFAILDRPFSILPPRAMLSFDDLYKSADSAKPRLTVAAAGAADATVLAALAHAHARGWAEPVLVGEAVAIRAIAASTGVDIAHFRVVDAADSAAAAIAEVGAGRAQLLMKGQVDTPALVRAILSSTTGWQIGRAVCQVVLMEIVDQNRRFLMADTGITIQPNLEQKAEMIENLIAAARSLGVDAPRVALVAATEKATPSMPDTLESFELARRNAAGEFAGAVVHGPLSFDLAYSADAGEKKHIGGGVVGSADALLFPNLLAANLTVKAIMYTARCRFGGVLMGVTPPVVFMSRADTVETRLNSLGLAIRLAQSRRASAATC
jgi:phosphate butyryltransferase